MFSGYGGHHCAGSKSNLLALESEVRMPFKVSVAPILR
jgi:hypothetical protein